MILPKREKIDVTKKVSFSSDPYTSCHDVSEDMHAINVQLGNLHFVAYTIDQDFSRNLKQFEGEIQITHDSGWATRADMLKLGRAQVIFRFPEQHGKREVLATYIPKNFLGELKGC